jgi:hypothetical protein
MVAALTGDELRGERLREVAAKVLWQHFREGEVVHYKHWFDLVIAEGIGSVGRTLRQRSRRRSPA